MGNTKSQTRGLTVARGAAPVEDDPFAELADIFESELRYDARFDEEPAAQRPARLDPVQYGRTDAIDLEFEAAFENDIAAARNERPVPSVPNYETRYNGRSTAMAASKDDSLLGRRREARPSRLTDEEIDDELDAVLRNLSAPASPRGRIVVETQSFAPERHEEERLPLQQHDEVDEFEELIRSELAVIRPAIAAPLRRPDRQAGMIAEPDVVDEFEPDDRYPVAAKRRSSKKAFVTGVSAIALLLVAGAGFTAWHGGSIVPNVGDGMLLIKADAEPFKVAPKDPGGRAYPNQNKAVYDRVAAPKSVNDAPTQQSLLKNVEEPIDLPKAEERNYDDLPGVELGEADDADAGKNETRVTSATETGEASAEPALQPRKVRTLAVGADGRLVDPGSPAAATSRKPPAPKAAAAVAAGGASTEDAIRAVATLDAPADGGAAAADPVEVSAVKAAKPAAPASRLPVAAPQQSLAAAEPTPAAAQPAAVANAVPASGFFVQVSSQPSEAAAQQSMRSFGSRYGSVVGGRQVGIQSADIPGKGTYWRVRVAASTREEATALCSKLKGAGASCLVTR